MEESWKNDLLSNHQNSVLVGVWTRLGVWMENILLFIVALMENGEENKVRFLRNQFKVQTAATRHL